MKSSYYFLASACLLMLPVFIVASRPKPEIRWTEGETGDNGKAVHCIEIVHANRLPENWTIWCSQISLGVKTLEGSDAVYSEQQANLHNIKPLERNFKDTLRIWYEGNPLRRRSWAPEGFTLQDGTRLKKLKTTYTYLPLASDGGKWYAYNDSFKLHEPSADAILPLPKNQVYPGETKPEGWYRLTVGDTVGIESEDEYGEHYARVTLAQLQDRYGGKVPETVIEDWPDYPYRGFMLDVARNFTTKDNVLRLIDLLDRYKVNYLQLHLTDDEGWRIEIEGIPELTEIGAHHSIFPDRGIQPSYDGNAFHDDKFALSNSYFSKKDYIEILRYAWDRKIRVIPEVDTPGHSRAAIYAMKQYEKRTGDISMRLQDPEDDSRYCSAQGYTDNVMSVELESVYKFAEKVFDTLIACHAEAGVPLPAIHIGGDEVPHGAWKGKDLHHMFMIRMAEMAKAKGVKISGWQEVTKYNDPVLREVLFSNNVWNVAADDPSLPYKIADAGFPTIVSDVNYTYADMAYSSNKEEIAHSWACFTDDVKSFGIPLREHENVLGVQAQMFTETVRSFENLCYNIFPKMTGVFERAWNRDSRESRDEYFSKLVYFEMPYWDEKGISYHVPQPGLIRENGVVKTNSLIPGAQVVVGEQGDRITAKARYGKMSSVTTTL